MRLVLEINKSNSRKWYSKTYKLEKFKSYSLSVLDSANNISFVGCPRDLSEPVTFLASWFSSHGTSLYNWWHSRDRSRYEFGISFSYGTLRPKDDVVVILRWEYDYPTIFVIPKSLHHSQYQHLVTLIGSTSKGMYGEDQKLEILTTDISDESLAFLRLGLPTRFKIRGEYW